MGKEPAILSCCYRASAAITAACALLLCALPALAAERMVGDVLSPDATLRAQVSVDAAGSAHYRVLRDGREVLLRSRLGLVRDDADFSRGLQLIEVSPVAAVHDRYELLTGKRRINDYRANRRVFSWRGANGERLQIEFQVSDDGVAFRYDFPQRDPNIRELREDATTFRFAAATRAWLQPMSPAKTGFGRTNPSYEEYYLQDIGVGTPSPLAAGWVYPALFRHQADWVLLSEGSLGRGHAGSRLRDVADAPGEYAIGMPDPREVLPGGAANPRFALPWRSPWRIVAVGSLKTIAESTLGTDLADPPVAAPVAPPQPGKASWSWPLLGDGATTFEVQKRYIDFAARMGWRYTLIDALWDTQIGEDKLRELIAYARAKQVAILLWYNSAGSWNDAPQTPRDRMLTHASRIREFARLKAMGVAGVKIDFFGGDGQSMIGYYLDIMQDAAPYGLMLNFHGATLPRGWQRTWPDLMTMEAVRGLEFATFEQANADQVPAHAAMLPFARNVFDPMDFTSLALVKLNDKVQRRTTPGFELAETVLFVSGIQHYAETPENLEKAAPEVQALLRELPSVWDDSRYVDGYPGRFAVFARRGGTRWYVAGINADAQPRTLRLNLAELGVAGRGARLIVDGDGPLGLTSRRIEVGPTQNVEVALPARGGFVLQFD
ncbi:glycoside hydrolase family 97 protein [Xanthomonas translucens pv. graminis]|nr:exported putative alpha-glucosidase [Xanthomonas translucens pv. graminis ART-Xtg29]OAX61418.1 alpha-glucosidase [Xanthomonas translucens pv. graminis]UKE53482.1 glycoside hydrolase family 97 protein [Xanthomonas translucens pv. graminis]WIH07800.1 glycoside hydrolase family 97 protein [Xanthomonas translucens pv. graminis]WIH13442.1 glycoside hydrolase family 97 protein [Xanthomonas translucens pv. graminis]